MDNLPALIRSAKPGSKYHITDDGQLTRCGRRISNLVETHPLALDPEERCPHCGTAEDFEKISDLRGQEIKASHEAHMRQMKQIEETRQARNEARPALVDGLKQLLSIFTGAIEHKHYLNADNLVIPVLWKNQVFTIKIEVWNGTRE